MSGGGFFGGFGGPGFGGPGFGGFGGPGFGGFGGFGGGPPPMNIIGCIWKIGGWVGSTRPLSTDR